MIQSYTNPGINTRQINLNEAKEKFLENCLRELSNKLTDEQYSQVRIVIVNELSKVEVLDPLRGYDERLEEEADKLLELFLNTKKLEGLSKNSLTAYKGELDKLFTYLNKKPVSLITAEDIRGYLAWKISEDGGSVSMKTANNLRRYFSSFFNWCFNEDHILKSPMVKIKPFKEPKIKKQEFTDFEVEQLRKELNERIFTSPRDSNLHEKALRDRAIFEVLLSSGMRVGEIVRLKYGDIDFQHNTSMVLGKGNKERRIFFTDVAKVYLMDYLRQLEKNTGEPRKDTDYLFVANKGNPRKKLGMHGLERNLRELGESAGVDKCHPHRCRRTFATRMIRKGMSLEKVQQLLGHEDANTTMIYVNVSDKGLAHEYDKFSD